MKAGTSKAISGLAPQARRQYLVDHGLCPVCGEEAAPWYLCPRHRQIGSIRRMLNKAVRHGAVEKAGKDRHGNLYRRHSDFAGNDNGFRNAWNTVRWGTYLGDMKDGDKRTRPRLGRRPVDLDATLIQIFVDADRPLSLDEVTLAWGKLRSQRKTGSLAGDMTKLIRAQRRREERNARRIAI